MANTVFVDQETIIQASWANDVNSITYILLGNGTTAPLTRSELIANLGLSSSGTVTSVTSADANVTVANQTTTPVITIVAAPKWQVGRTLSITGDLSYTSPSLDGTTNVTAAGTLATVNSNVGTWGDGTHVAQFIVDGKGRITAAANVPITAGSGTVTSVSVVSANGLAGSVATATTTPAITLSTTVTGILKGDGTSISAASAGIDYLTPSGNGSNLTNITATQVGLGNVTNNAQVKKSASSTIGNIPTWTVTTGDQLDTTGYGVVTTVGTPGTNTNIPTEKAVRDAVAASVSGVSSVAATDANGFTWNITNPTSTPNLTLSTSVTGLVKGNGTALSAATANTDYVPAVMTTAGDIMYGGALGVATRLGIGGANTVLHGGASAPTYSAVVEADITLSDNTTNNVSTTKHGFMPKLPNDASIFYNGQGNFTTPSGLTIAASYLKTIFSGQTSVNVIHNFNTQPIVQVFDNSGVVFVPLTITHNTVNDFTVTFTNSETGTIVSSVGGPQPNAVTIVSASTYTILITDKIVKVTTLNAVITLPTAVGNTGREFWIKNSSGGSITLNTTSSQTISGQLTQTINSQESLTVFSDGSNYEYI